MPTHYGSSIMLLIVSSLYIYFKYIFYGKQFCRKRIVYNGKSCIIQKYLKITADLKVQDETLLRS